MACLYLTFPANGTVYFNYLAKVPFLSSIKILLLRFISEQLDLTNFLLLYIALFFSNCVFSHFVSKKKKFTK